MRDEVRRARKAFDQSKPVRASSCARCGMTQEQHNAHGKGQLQIHHIRPIRELGMAANDPSNYHTLCYFCHSEYHKFWELAKRSYEDFFAAPSFFKSLI